MARHTVAGHSTQWLRLPRVELLHRLHHTPLDETEEIPKPENTLKLLASERVTLCRGRPDQAGTLARHRGNTELSTLLPGSLEALLSPQLRAEPGARANLFGMTEAFGPYCGYAADTDMPRSTWGSCGKPFARTAHPARHPSSQPQRDVHRRRLLPVVEVDDEVVTHAADLAYQLSLRGYDAVHCASAAQLSDDTVVAASGDQRLLTAWSQLGLATYDTGPA